MSSTEVLSAYIKKLSHPLKEIRERALKLLAAKLQLGWELQDELSGTRQLLEALLAWFHAQQPSLQREALELLLMVLKTKSGTYIAREFGIQELVAQLINLRYKIDQEALELYEDVLETLRFLNTVQSQDSLSVPRLNIPSVSSSECEEGPCRDYDHLGPNFQSSNPSSVSNEEIEINRYNEPSEGINVLLFPWAVMSPSDSKTILLIEDALKLLKSTRRCCRFIRDVFLRDFPAEIFLNRPAIIQNLFNIIGRDNSGKLSEPLQVLLCIIQALRTRLRQLSSLDLIHQTNKLSQQHQHDHNDRMTTELEEIVSDAGLACDFRVGDDGLEALRQLPAPMCALDGLQTILTVMARSLILQDPSGGNDVLHLNELNLSISLVECLVGLLLDCVSESFWSLDHSSKTYRDIAHKSVMVMRQLGDLLNKYRTSFVENTSRTHHVVTWLRLVFCAERVLHWTRESALSPASLIGALQTAQLDPALEMFYTHLFRLLVSELQDARTSANKEFKGKYKELTKLFSAMEAAAAFIKNKDSCRNSPDVLKIIKHSLPVLELHLSDGYLADVSDIILKKAKDWDFNDKDWSEARSIALSLMAHNSEWVQSRFYTMMAEMVKMVFVDDNEDHVDNEKCLTLFCDVGILTEICCHGLNSKSKEVENSASETMLYLLRGRLILSEGCWWRLLASLLPTYPLLHVYAAHDTALGQAICKSLERDIAECMGVSETEVLAGLVRLLFVRCPTVQMDAAHSLCHLLDEHKYLPPPESLRADVLMSALKRVDEQDFSVGYSNSPVKSSQSSGLGQVLDVLKQDLIVDDEGHGLTSACLGREPTLEPSLRRATLQQLAVLMMQHDQHDSFLQFDGINIVVAILRMSLLVDDYLAFPECAISCVSVLNSICFGSRHVLAKIPDLPALLLRVILIFPANETAVQMAAQLLALVVWAGFALQELDKDRKRALALPASVVAKTRLPFPALSYWSISPNAVHSSIEWLQSSEEWRAAIRVRWSFVFNGTRLLHTALPPGPLAAPPGPLAAPPGPLALRITPHDLICLQAACPLYGSTKGLLALQNATSHRQVNEALALLESYTQLLPKSSVRTSDFAALPWHSTLSRFLTAPPASPRDVVLLTSLLKFVIAYMDNVPNEGDTMAWIKASFLASESSMISLLDRERLYPQQSLQDNIEVTQLHIHIVKVLVRCVVLMGGGGEGLLKILLACLEKVDLKNFHMLGYLNELLRCIRYTVNCHYISLSEETILECLSLMTRTLSGCAAGGGRKGQGCRLDAMLTLLALLRLLHELQVPVQRWSEAWTCSGEVLRVVVSCTRSPRAELRAGALAVLAALAHYTQMLTHLLDAVPTESLSQYAAEIFAEKSEANIVRASAATLLTALATRASAHFDVYEQDMLLQIKDNHFMELSLGILVAFSNNENEYKNCHEPNVPLSLLERRSELEVRARKHGSFHISPSFPSIHRPPPTPGLVAALADVVYNLCGFAKCPVKMWNDQGLFRLLFRCASWSHGPTSDNLLVRAAACRALARLADGHKCVRTTLAYTKDCLHNLLATLTPLSEEESSAAHLHARAQAMVLLATLLSERAACDSILRDLKDCSASLFHLLLQSLQLDESDLQDAGLYCLTQLSQSVSKKKHVDKTLDVSWIQFLDNLKSPYFVENTPRVPQIFSAGDSNYYDNCQPEFLTEEMCKDLMHLYQKYAIDKKKFQASQDGNWPQVCSCLSSLFSVSSKAREYAVHRDFSKTLLLTLQGVRDYLSMNNKTVDLIRNANNNPVLLTLYWLLTTISSLMTSCPRAKESFASDSIAVSLIRLWPWCMMTELLRVAVVELLLIFTNNSPQAWSAMSTCVGGRSLISEISSLIIREAALLSRPRPAPLLSSGLHTLRHCVKHHHCRALILKSDVLSCIHKIRVAERSRLGKAALSAWAQLAEAISRHSDGAASLLDLRAVLTAPKVRGLLMPAVAHAAHYHRNTFLQAPDLLELLSGTLLAGDPSEIVSAARAIWAIAANNHRAKLALRSAGVTAAVHTTMERLQRSRRDALADRTLQLLTYTNTVLQTS